MRKWMGLMTIAAALAACAPDRQAETVMDEIESGNGFLVEGMYEAFARGDVDAVRAALAEDVIWNEAENFPYADNNPYIGPQAVVEGVFARLGREWDYWRVVPGEVIEAGDRVVVTGRYDAKYAETGIPINAQFVHLWRLENGQVTEFQQYTDTAQVQVATGQLEVPEDK